MDPLTMMLIGGGISAALMGGGSALNFGLSKSQMKRQAQYQRELMNHQYNLQSKMIQNYHGWNTSSLRNAGINPMLSGNYGGSGGGSFGATVTSPQADFDFSNVASTAMQAASLKNTLEKQEAEADLAQQNAINNWDIQRNEIRNSALQGDLLKAQKDQVELENKQLEFTNSALKADSDFYKSGWGKTMRFIDRTLEPAKGLVGGSVNKNYNSK